MTYVGQKAPSFQAPAVVNGEEIVQDFSLKQYIGKQAVVLFFYPKDFTFVCPTELYGLQKRIEAFEKRNVAVVGCSTDSEESHWAWLHVEPSQGGIKGVKYPLIADTSKTIATNFGVLGGNWYVDEKEQLQFEGSPVAHRGVFLIDKEGIIRHMLVNDFSLGRSIDEILRTIDMMQHVEEHGEVCPLDWQRGKTSFKPTSDELIAYLANELSPCKCEGCPCDGSCNCGDSSSCDSKGENCCGNEVNNCCQPRCERGNCPKESCKNNSKNSCDSSSYNQCKREEKECCQSESRSDQNRCTQCGNNNTSCQCDKPVTL